MKRIVHLPFFIVLLLIYSLTAIGADQTSSASTPCEPVCSRTSVGFIPLPDLATGTYHKKKGGLYPGGKNVRPSKHEAAGLMLAKKIGPLDAAGKPSENGKYVLLSIGMSNAGAEFNAFMDLARNDQEKDNRLALVNAGVPRWPANRIIDPNAGFWDKVDQQLARKNVTGKQVAIVWIKQADSNPKLPFPKDAKKLQTELVTIVRIIQDKFPNVKLAYLSSRIYAGYASTNLNPEPFAYQSGFAVKWLIRSQLLGAKKLNFDKTKGPVQAPWLSWGPYLWADGLMPRNDGLTWECFDFKCDGTHPSGTGTDKVASLLLQFFRNDSTAREWYLAHP